MDCLGLEIGQIKKLLENMNNMGMGFTQAPESNNCLIRLESMGENLTSGIKTAGLEENMSGDDLEPLETEYAHRPSTGLIPIEEVESVAVSKSQVSVMTKEVTLPGDTETKGGPKRMSLFVNTDL
jgi:hypothetical protein